MGHGGRLYQVGPFLASVGGPRVFNSKRCKNRSASWSGGQYHGCNLRVEARAVNRLQREDHMPPELPYAKLTPDVVLESVESVGFRCDGRILALNSYENRVYQLGTEAGAFVVV